MTLKQANILNGSKILVVNGKNNEVSEDADMAHLKNPIVDEVLKAFEEIESKGLIIEEHADLFNKERKLIKKSFPRKERNLHYMRLKKELNKLNEELMGMLESLD